MSDPFTFDPDKVLLSLRTHEDKREPRVLVRYEMPDGTGFFNDCEPVEASVDQAIETMKIGFDARLANLSAHQRLTWMAAARAEGMAS